MSALPQFGGYGSILNSVGLSAVFDRVDHAESWKESLLDRGNCKRKGPEMETCSVGSGNRKKKSWCGRSTEREKYEPEKDEVCRGRITWHLVD